MINYIKPECMPYYYSNGTKLQKNVTQSIASTTDGYLLPCCWCDAPNTKSDIIAADLYNTNLKITNNETIDDILMSNQWKNFINTILYNSNAAPKCCKEKCGVKNG